MGSERRPVTLAGSAVGHRCHASAFFHNQEEEYRLLLPFVKEGGIPPRMARAQGRSARAGAP
jgi:hypothetical protein